MPTFRFRLQRVLDWQERVCRLEEEKLGQRLSELAAVEAHIARLTAGTAAIEQGFVQSSEITPSGLWALGAFRKTAVIEREKLVRNQAERQAAVAAQRERLLAEKQRLQVLEKLRERAWSAHLRENNRQLEALASESYLAKYNASKS